ncbi:hypothetical protein NPIL_667871 [Nephila pilipes]|uniref:Uncharacterized protein n=1 Tax=Nephila pilipes TaxID=299642 RepID=A0A8X6TDZ8_NEPPI|nr:hypothetical protein NPIL_667871 [Nephila pilipes]
MIYISELSQSIILLLDDSIVGAPLYPRNKIHLNDVEAFQFTSEEKFQSATHSRKCYVHSVLGQKKSVILLYFLQQESIHAGRNYDILTKIRFAIQRKRLGLLSTVLRSLSTAQRRTQEGSQGVRFITLDMSVWVTLSTALMLLNFQLFPALKVVPSEYHFQNNIEVE